MLPLLSNFWADGRYAARLLAKNPGFTCITVLSLALAIGANTAIFSMANELLFARLAVPRAQELRSLLQMNHSGTGVSIWNGSANEHDGVSECSAFPYPLFRVMAQARPHLFGYQGISNITLTGAGEPRAVAVQMVTGNFYSGMQVRPALGRALLESDDHVDAGAPLVAVLSYGLWQRAFAGSKTVLGRTVRLNGSLATIVGVNALGFTGADDVQISPDLFVPLTAVSQLQPLIGNTDPLHSAELSWVHVALRSEPGQPDNQVAARLSVTLASASRALHTRASEKSLPWVALQDGSRGDGWQRAVYGKPIYALLGLVSLVLLLASVNIANLMLGRARTRARELSLRMALGAGRARLFRQMLTECLLLASLGGTLGLLLAFAVRNVVPRLLWEGRSGSTLVIPFDWQVFAFTAGVTVLSAVLSGLVPAWRAARSEPGEALKTTGPTATGRRRFLGGKLLVTLEVALSLVLVAGSALFLRTMLNLREVHTGFHARGLLLFDLDLPQTRYPARKNAQMHGELLRAIRQVPGVQSASLATIALVANSMSNASFHLEHGAPGKQPADAEYVDLDSVAPAFFGTMQIPILAGRDFSEADARSGRPVAIINQALARKYLPKGNPVGRAFRISSKGPWTEIIGVCGDTLYADPHEQPPPLHFDLLTSADDVGDATYLIRTTAKPDALIPSLRRAVARLDPDLPLIDIRTQEEQIAQVTRQERLMAALSLGFGTLALLLASVGVYGVLSYSTAERTREIGIRLALGAQPGAVRGMILREAALLAGAGTVAGLGITLALARLVRSLLYGVAPNDLVALCGATALLLTLALLAAWLPARRAASIDPIAALRSE